MIKHVLLMSIVLIGVIAGTAQAQNKVVVIPLGGDDISSLPAFPQVWAQTDVNAARETESFVGDFNLEMNSVLIDAPSDGVIVISGKTFIQNDSSSIRNFGLKAKIDGSPALAGDADAVLSLSTSTESDSATMNYHITVPITAGQHTVSQELSPRLPFAPSTAFDFFRNAEVLTVMFFATGEVTGRPCSENCDENGGEI